MAPGMRDGPRPERFRWEPGQASVRSAEGEELLAPDALPLGEEPEPVVVTPEVDAEVADMEALRRQGVLDEEAYGVDR